MAEPPKRSEATRQGGPTKSSANYTANDVDGGAVVNLIPLLPWAPLMPLVVVIVARWIGGGA